MKVGATEAEAFLGLSFKYVKWVLVQIGSVQVNAHVLNRKCTSYICTVNPPTNNAQTTSRAFPHIRWTLNCMGQVILTIQLPHIFIPLVLQKVQMVYITTSIMLQICRLRHSDWLKAIYWATCPNRQFKCRLPSYKFNTPAAVSHTASEF